VLVAVLVLWAGIANAGRKRIVVLEFEGPKAEKFHADVVKLVKKSHTVITTDKWNAAAEELDAGNPTEKNIKKIAKKLKIDGIVQGKIEKRRNDYLIHLKLRAGTSGEVVGSAVDTKASGAKLDSKAQRDLKDELVGAIDELEANHGGGGDDDDADTKPKKKKGGDDADDPKTASKKGKSKAGGDDDDTADDAKHGGFSKHADKGGDKVAKADDDDAKPAAKKGKTKGGDDEGDDAKPGKKKKGDVEADAKAGKKKGDADDAKPAKKKADADVAAALSTKHDDDDSPLATKKADPSDDDDGEGPRKAKKKVAHRGEDDDASAEAHTDADTAVSAQALSPAERAVDATVGLSFIARHMSFTFSSQLAGSQIPPGYKQSTPVGGAYVDATIYPLAIGHKGKGLLQGLGVEVLYDRVLRISSEKADNMGVQHTLATVSERYGVGAVLRVPVGSLAVGARAMYMGQSFLIEQHLPDGEVTDIPNVRYGILSLGGFARYPLTPAINLDVDAAFLAVLTAGTSMYDIGNAAEYGKATVSGEELAVGADYALTPSWFLRAQFRVETIAYKFAGGPATLANNRDTNPDTQDVTAARDTYFGGMVTAGFAY
jgi:hypothetical protein